MSALLYDIAGLELWRGRGSGYRLSVPRLCIRHGEQVAITGPSGCGKSTCLDLLGMILAPERAERFSFRPDDAEVDIAALWQDRDLDAMAVLRRGHLRYILQTGELLPFLSVEENITLSASLAGMDSATALARALELLDTLNIAKLRRAMPSTLSVGERQRTAIARALACNPQVVLADEPTAALDPAHARGVMHLFTETLKALGTTVIMVSHDVSLVHEFGFREICMRTEMQGEETLATLDGGEVSA